MFPIPDQAKGNVTGGLYFKPGIWRLLMILQSHSQSLQSKGQEESDMYKPKSTIFAAVGLYHSAVAILHGRSWVHPGSPRDKGSPPLHWNSTGCWSAGKTDKQNNKVRRAESVEGNIKICFREQEGKISKQARKACERVNKRRKGYRENSTIIILSHTRQQNYSCSLLQWVLMWASQIVSVWSMQGGIFFFISTILDYIT